MEYSYFSHPESVCMSYFDHFCFSLKLSKMLCVASYKAFIHAIFPNAYITSSSDLVDELKHEFDTVGCDKKKE